MGATFEVDSLEDMCALMCDNRVPERSEKMNKGIRTIKNTYAGEKICRECKHRAYSTIANCFGCDQEECEYEHANTAERIEKMEAEMCERISNTYAEGYKDGFSEGVKVAKELSEKTA